MTLHRVESRMELPYAIYLGGADTGLPGVLTPEDYRRSVYVTVGDTERLLVDKLQEFVSVKDFGATGDGVADDTDAFDAAIDWANNSSASHVVIYVPPGNYLLATGTTEDIARNNVIFWAYGARFLVDSGSCFTWGDSSSVYYGGGIWGAEFHAASAEASQVCVTIDGHNNLSFIDCKLSTVMSFLVAGTSSSDLAGGVTIENLTGTTVNTNGSIVIDAKHGSGLVLNNVRVNATGATVPSDRSTALGANTTIFLRLGQGVWDTVNMSDVVINRYDKGIVMDAQSGANVLNVWGSNVVVDTCASNGLYMTSSGGVVHNINFVNSWFVAVDGHAVETAGTTGALRYLLFSNCISRLSGKNNWKLASQVQEHVELHNCHGYGANRLSANTGPDQDDLYVQYDGVKVVGGSFGRDGSTFSGISGQQARYGVTLPQNTSNIYVTGVESTGTTDAFQAAVNTSAVTNVLVANNTETGAVDPNYAATSSPAAPTSGATQTWHGPYRCILYIYGGTDNVTEHNGVQVGATGDNVMLHLHPGDTWEVTNTGDPTIRRVILP